MYFASWLGKRRVGNRGVVSTFCLSFVGRDFPYVTSCTQFAHNGQMICMICMIYSHYSSWSAFRADRFLICVIYLMFPRGSRTICTSLGQVSWVGLVLHSRSCTTSHNVTLGSTWSRSWSICKTCAAFSRSVFFFFLHIKMVQNYESPPVPWPRITSRSGQGNEPMWDRLYLLPVKKSTPYSCRSSTQLTHPVRVALWLGGCCGSSGASWPSPAGGGGISCPSWLPPVCVCSGHRWTQHRVSSGRNFRMARNFIGGEKQVGTSDVLVFIVRTTY